ncbi:MAG: hypothetical protein RBS19_01355 [Bacteroidales bacterium]|nr:hypothetical protein [Bacteroidales bacterium]MDY0215576.1 hypothetical protein [Bacteroidales bacterium]
MKQKIGLIILAILVSSGFLFQSCKKETTEVNMIVKNWHLISKTVLSINVDTDCDLNSKWDFKTDGSYVIKDSCDDIKTGTWKLAEDGKTLTLDNITAYAVVENSLLSLVIEMQVGEVGLVRWMFR